MGILDKLKLYGFIGSFRLFRDLFFTKIFYSPARIIRFPLYLRSPKKFRFGDNFTSGVGLRIDILRLQGELIIGENVQINDYCHIGVFNKIEIGSETIIGSKVLIMDHNHGSIFEPDPLSSPLISPIKRPLVGSPVSIGKKVWIGESVNILPGTIIGDGCIIASGSVVSGSFPSSVLISGNPARIKMYYEFNKKSWKTI